VRTASFTGASSIRSPAERPLYGSILQKQKIGTGDFLGTTEGGLVTITHTAQP
jgi:hypothetical protein